MNEKKLKLIEALEKERERLSGRGVDVVDHDVTIQYLKDGSLPTDFKDIDKYEILDATMNDFEMVCSDYDVK